MEMYYGTDISSFRLQYYDAATRGCVNVFKDSDCTGYSGFFCDDSDLNDSKSYYSKEDLWLGHIWDNEANAI